MSASVTIVPAASSIKVSSPSSKTTPKSLGFSIDSLVGQRKSSDEACSEDRTKTSDDEAEDRIQLHRPFVDSMSSAERSQDSLTRALQEIQRQTENSGGNNNSASPSPCNSPQPLSGGKRSPSPGSHRLLGAGASPPHSPLPTNLVRPIPSLPGGGPGGPAGALRDLPGLSGLPLPQNYLDHLANLKALYDRNAAVAALASHGGGGVPQGPPGASSALRALIDHGPREGSGGSEAGKDRLLGPPPQQSSSNPGPGAPPPGSHLPPVSSAMPPSGLLGLNMRGHPAHPNIPPVFLGGGMGPGGPGPGPLGGPHIPREYPLYPWFLSRNRFPGGENLPQLSFTTMKLSSPLSLTIRGNY